MSLSAHLSSACLTDRLMSVSCMCEMSKIIRRGICLCGNVNGFGGGGSIDAASPSKNR